MAFRFEFNVKPRRGIIQLVIERDDKLLCLDLTPKEVAKGYDCGIQIKNYNDIKELDVIEAYQEVAVKKKLK